MNCYASNENWSDQFLPDIKRIVGGQWGNKSNPDGTQFTWFDVRSFPNEPPLVIARSP